MHVTATRSQTTRYAFEWWSGDETPPHKSCAGVSRYIRRPASFVLALRMPVNAMPAKWAEGPCLFRFPCVSTAVCTRCKDSFTFLNGRRHCEFCGYVFHRVHCTRKIKLDGEFFRRRICTHCDFYRNIAGASLRDGKRSHTASDLPVPACSVVYTRWSVSGPPTLLQTYFTYS